MSVGKQLGTSVVGTTVVIGCVEGSTVVCAAVVTASVVGITLVVSLEFSQLIP